MHLLFHIVYAGHARGTHHKLALDALRHLKCVDADLWQGLFLANAKLYLEGSKAPDNEFKDFKNHVLHTRDGYWGGAPDKVRSWYQHLVEGLAQKDWQTAVYCAGVLSHYYTDPLHPFHTGQSEAENNIHRACEWSISKSYDALRTLGEQEFAGMDVDLPRDPNWLAQLVCAGAVRANGYYEKLIAHYDFTRGVVDPPAGLDRVSQRIIAELLRYAAISFGAILDRAIGEANVDPPNVSLLAPTLLAAGETPFKVLARRIADAEERRTVERMYDELITTGTVDKHLTEDDRTVRDLHAKEVLAQRVDPPPVSKVFPFKPREQVAARIDLPRARRGGEEAPATASIIPLRPVTAAPAPAPAIAPMAAEEAVVEIVRPQPRPPAVRVPISAAQAPREPEAPDQPAAAASGRAKSGLTQRLEQLTVAPLTPRERKGAQATAPAEPRFHLTPDQDVVDGPSIGPKTAERLHPHGIRTVRDLLKADPAALAVLVDAKHITAEAIADWQDQARLVCTVPGLRATHAQLLVGAGYRSGESIAAAEAEKLCADVLAFAASPAGQRLLRNGDPPDVEKIKGWLEAAQSVKAA